jgi:hypothetical protein
MLLDHVKKIYFFKGSTKILEHQQIAVAVENYEWFNAVL